MSEAVQYRRAWRLRSMLGDVCILSPRDLREHEHPIAFSGLSGQIDAWLADGLARSVLLDICRTVGGGSLAAQWKPAELRLRVKSRLKEAFLRGELVLVATVQPQLSSTDAPPAEGEEPPSSSRPVSESVKTWIEIELVDEEGVPVEGERYQIELPDGRHVTGTLNARGRARIEGIDRGACEVWFPDRNANEWRRL